MGYASHLNSDNLPSQLQPRDPRQERNAAGGYAYTVDPFEWLDRFLILGTQNGNFYATEQQLTFGALGNLDKCISDDWSRVLDKVLIVSHERRAISPNPAIFVLAYLTAYGADASTEAIRKVTAPVRRAAAEVVTDVCYTGSHILRFVDELTDLRGLETIAKRAVQGWYLQKPVDELAYQVAKYQRRHGWSHGDVLRMIRPNPNDGEDPELRSALFAWCVGKYDRANKAYRANKLRRIVATEVMKGEDDTSEICELIMLDNMPRECVPTEHRKDPDVWNALLRAGGGMPYWALLRNLANMTRSGLLTPDSEAERYVCEALQDPVAIRKSGVHPIKVLVAYDQYNRGCGHHGSTTWDPVPSVVDALEVAYLRAFESVDGVGGRWLLAVDISGSMRSAVTGHPSLSAAVAALSLASVRARVEERCSTALFSAQSLHHYGIEPIDLNTFGSLGALTEHVSTLSAGGTDCALPFEAAREQGALIDHFVVYTDHETWAGDVHPQEALERYRKASGINASAVFVALNPVGEFTVADPQDPGTMDVVGFDTAIPDVISNFALTHRKRYGGEDSS